MSRSIAIDLGAHRTRVYDAEGRSLYDQDSVVAVDFHTNQIAAVGHAAKSALVDNAGRLRLERPFRRGIASSLDSLESYVESVLDSVGIRSLGRVRLVLSYPIGLSNLERDVISSVLDELGAREVVLVGSTLAALLGCDVDPSAPEGVMIYCAGASQTEASIFSLGEMVSYAAGEGAGDLLAERVVRLLSDRFGVVVTQEVAEEIVANLIDLGSEHKTRQANVWGRDAKSGAAAQARISELEVTDCLQPVLDSLYRVATTTLSNCQAELVSDVASRGVFIVGGCVNMSGFGQQFVKHCNVNVTIPKSPELAVVRGLVKILRGDSRVTQRGFLEMNSTL